MLHTATTALSYTHTINAIQYNTDALPRLDSSIRRRTLEKGILPDGQNYAIQLLKPEDAASCYKLCEAEYDNAEANGKCYLLRRDSGEIKHILDFDREKRTGGLVLGAVVNGNALAMISAVDLIDDEQKSGRGNAYKGDDACKAQQQIYFKMAVAHPDMRGANFAKIMYPHRLALGLLFDERKCFLTKVSGSKVKEAYNKNGWKPVDSYRLPEADNPDYTLTEDEKNLVTFKLTRNEALAQLQENHQDVFQNFDLHKQAFNVMASRHKPVSLPT